MGRPAIINRQKVAEAALRLIDEEGLEALSVERIASELGVRGPSLYHHFPDKAAILSEVARLVLGDLELDREAESWQQWMVDVGLTFFRRVLEHPRAAAILMEFLPDSSSVRGLARAAKMLTDAGVDPSVQALLMEGCEKLAWGWALQRAFMTATDHPRLSRAQINLRWPELAAAVEVRDRRWSDEQMLEEAMYAFINGVLAKQSEAAADSVDTAHGERRNGKTSVRRSRRAPAPST
jgi:AcrR family transcriptional regulator